MYKCCGRLLCFNWSRKINESSSVDMCSDHPKGAINSASSPWCLISRRQQRRTRLGDDPSWLGDHSTPPSRRQTASVEVPRRDIRWRRSRRFGQQLTSGRQSGLRPIAFGPVVFLRTCPLAGRAGPWFSYGRGVRDDRREGCRAGDLRSFCGDGDADCCRMANVTWRD